MRISLLGLQLILLVLWYTALPTLPWWLVFLPSLPLALLLSIMLGGLIIVGVLAWEDSK